MSCIVPGCKHTKRFKPENISFFRLPVNEDDLTVWLNNMNVEWNNRSWNRNKVICSDHFKPDDMEVFPHKKVLKTGAVPTLKVEHNIIEPSASNQTLPINSSYTSSTSTSGGDLKKRTLKSFKRKFSFGQHITLDSSGSTTSVDSIKRRKIIRFNKEIHNYSLSPRKLKNKNLKLQSRNTNYRKELYSAKKRIVRAKTKITTLKTVVTELKKQNFLSEHATEHVESIYESVPHLLMKRYLQNVSRKTTTHEQYPPMLRQFACTLNFYSNKAYNYVREQFELSLPHPSTIMKWYSNYDCSPGFSNLAFDTLKIKVNEAEMRGENVICSLMLDEMAIKKQIEFDGKKMWGYIDIGIPMDTNEFQPATEALVLMLVAQKAHWKIPVGYFLIKSLTGKEKANIIKECLIRLDTINVIVTSVTCDGPAANFSMLRELGCDLSDINNIKSWFEHPSTGNRVYCILDACHMLKLIRNMLASLGEFLDPEHKKVSWEYIKALFDLQEKETLNIGNKLKKNHIEWYRQKMKVNLAAQTLSKSIADALQYLKDDLRLPIFENSGPTIAFIRKIDFLFDILNSRSPWGKEFKSPLKIANENNWRPFLSDTMNYLIHCTNIEGRPLWNTTKKTPIIGFVITSLSICGIFDTYVKTQQLNYLLTYKCSQDHLEMFFCMIRSRNGWNNNPTAKQFAYTYRRLLLHTKLSSGEGNCRVLDTTTILTVPSTNKRKDVSFDVSLFRKYDIEPVIKELEDHDYDSIPYISLSEVSKDIIVYISGFVVKMLRRYVKCQHCWSECGISIESSKEDPLYKLLFLKNRGGLHIPSKGVIRICLKTEENVRKILHYTNNNIPKETGFIQYFTTIVAQQFFDKIDYLFPNLKEHFNDFSPIDENHKFILIKEIIYCYTKIRLHNLAKKMTTKIQGTAVRQQLNKLILFNHQ